LSQNLVTVIEDRRSSPRIIVRKFLCLISTGTLLNVILRLFLHTKPVNFDPLAFCEGLTKLLLLICEVGSVYINIFIKIVNKIRCHGYPEFILKSTPGYPEMSNSWDSSRFECS